MSRDIAVIGAGVIGCAVAYELARRGASVQVVDRGEIGMGSTQASAGMLAPYIEAREGNPMLDLAVRSLDLYDELVARVGADSGMPIRLHRAGTLDVAFDAADMQGFEETARVLARRRVDARLLDGTAARDDEPHLADGVAGALLIPDHAFVEALDFTRALAAAARRAGARFVERRRVRRIARASRDLVVETDAGALTASAVVLAAGTWSGEIDVEGAGVRLPVHPVRGQLLQLSWVGAPLRRIVWSRHRYLVPWEDGTVLVGATGEEAGFDERATVAGVRDLLDAACEVVPHAWTAGFKGARVGLRPATADALPVIGASLAFPNLMYATGHFRNGILLAPLTAALVADAMLDGRVDPALDVVAPSRFGLP